MQNNYRFAFFPYLKTSGTVNYHGIRLRSSDDLEDVPKEIISHIVILRNLFYLRESQKIKGMSYTFWERGEANEEEKGDENYQKLLELSTIFAYVYSSPHPAFGDPFLTQEHASCYIFSPKQFSKFLIYDKHNIEMTPEQHAVLENDEINDVDGYEVLLNDKYTFWVTERLRIYPTAPSFWLNISQDIYVDLTRYASKTDYFSVFNHFSSNVVRGEFDQRILTSLTWANRSVSINVPEELAVVFLAIAFESLLGLKHREKITERFKESVTLLLGNISRLDSWLTQFYKARSQILHEGWSSNLMFLAIDLPNKKNRSTSREYRSLVSYGRHIFRICVATIMTGSKLAGELGVPSMLVTNQERFERICKTLDQKELSTYEKIIGIRQEVWDINVYQFVEESGLQTDTLLGAARRIVYEYLKLEPDESPEALALMEEFSKITRDNEHYRSLSLINDIRGHIGRLPEVNPSKSSEAGIVVSALLDSVWHYTFMSFYQMEKQKGKQCDG